MSEYVCRLHGESYDAIPNDAVQIGRGVSPLYRFKDGSFHCLSSTKLGRRKKSTAQEPEEKNQ